MEKEMRAKKAQRKCMVRGCPNTEAYAISLTRESGNSVIICADCANKAAEAITKCKESTSDAKPKKNSGPPPLFPHGAMAEQNNNPEKVQKEAKEGPGNGRQKKTKQD